jgi:long-chain acyl-CoA synthetase
MLTHRNLADNLRYSTDGLQIAAGDTSISFLPLSHALARHLDYAIYGNDAIIAYLPRSTTCPGDEGGEADDLSGCATGV